MAAQQRKNKTGNKPGPKPKKQRAKPDLRVVSKKAPGFKGNPRLVGEHESFEYEQWHLEELARCFSDPIYFTKNYVKIVNLDRGLVLFDPYPYQQKLIESVFNETRVIAKFFRQGGKTTASGAAILHQVLFSPVQPITIAICANKATSAREVLDRVKVMYENLPRWMQSPVKVWNKTEIKLLNGTTVFTSATGGSAIRGRSVNILYLDEFGHVPRNVQSDFMASVYPTITSGKNSKIIVTSTPNGFDLFHKIYSQAETGVNGYTIVNAHWTDIPGRDEAWKQDQINHLGSEEKFMQEFDAMFLGSAKTLISPHKLASLVPREPIEKNENTRIYEAPKKGHTYIISLDSSEGIGLDYHAAQIIDVTTTPYVQVGIFHTNKLRYTSVPSFIDFLSKKYNDAFILIELNSTGMEISNLLSHDLENENLLSTQTKKGKQILGMGFGVGSKFGLKASVATKSTGCMSLKTLIEKDHLIINDKETIEELFCYVSAKRGFQGDGRNDDTVSALVNFSWASSQESFENLVDPKVREKLLEEAEKEAEEDLSFFGFITDGTEDDEQFSDLDGMRGEVQKDFSSLFGFSTA